MFCPRCRDEYREGFTWCHDCNVALVESLPSQADRKAGPEGTVPEDQAPVTVGWYFSPIEAHTYRMALEQAGLPAWVRDENVGVTYGVAIGATLQVRARDEAAARAILVAEPAPVSAFPPELAEPHCPQCGEDYVTQPVEIEEPTSRRIEQREGGRRYKCASCGHRWSELRHDVVEPAHAGAEETRERRAPAQEEPSTENDHPPRTVERIELIAVLLITSAYPIFWHLLNEPDDQPIRPGQLMAHMFWLGGLTVIVWMLLRSRHGSLPPIPLPSSVTQWAREVFVGLMLFLGLWALHPWLSHMLRDVGVPDAPSPWAQFFRVPGVAAVYFLESFAGVVYEEVVFRAYLLSRLGLFLGKRRAWSVVAAATLFALVHGYAPRSTLIVFADGVVYGLVYLSSRSLPRLVLAHWIYDLAVMSHYIHGK